MGLVLVEAEPYCEQVGGHLWWRRWGKTQDLLFVWTIVDVAPSDALVPDEASEEEFRDYDSGRVSHYGEGARRVVDGLRRVEAPAGLALRRVAADVGVRRTTGAGLSLRSCVELGRSVRAKSWCSQDLGSRLWEHSSCSHLARTRRRGSRP